MPSERFRRASRNAPGKVGERSWHSLFGVSDTAMTFGASAPGSPPRKISGYGSLSSDQGPLARALLSVMLLARGRVPGPARTEPGAPAVLGAATHLLRVSMLRISRLAGST